MELAVKQKRPFARTAVAGLLLSTLLAACSGRVTFSSNKDAGADLDECRAYLAAFSECMHRLSPKKPEIADARVVNARLALERATDREQLRRTCAGGAAQLRASCQ